MNSVNMLMKNPTVTTTNAKTLNDGGKNEQSHLFRSILAQISSGGNDQGLVSVNQENQSDREEAITSSQWKSLQQKLASLFPGELTINLDMENMGISEDAEVQLQALAGDARELISQLLTTDGEQNVETISSKLLKLVEKFTSLDSALEKGKKQDSLTEGIDQLLETVKEMMNGDADFDRQLITNSIEKGLNQLQNGSLFTDRQQTLLSSIKKELSMLQKAENVTPVDLKKMSALLEDLKTELKNSNRQGVNQLETKTQRIWEELVQTYQRRKGMESSVYRGNASVTGKDVSKWLSNAIESQITGDKAAQASPIQSAAPPTQMTSMPMSRLEQYVIHVHQTVDGESVEEQVINQMKKIMNANRFITQPNGRMQMSIAIRPENLGEMNVRIMQVDGEMTVRIAVSTNATKDLLEKNLHQLRNIFSPHQVVIEKQDLSVIPSTDVQKEQAEQQNENLDEQGQQDQHNSGNDSNEEEFASYFEELTKHDES